MCLGKISTRIYLALLMVLLSTSHTFAITGDIDHSGKVDEHDFMIFLQAKDTIAGDPEFNPGADFNSDGAVDVTDLAMLTANFGFSGRMFSLWVADSDNNRVVKLLHDTGEKLADSGELYYPTSVAVNNSDGTLWVADHYNNRILKIAPDGTQLLQVVGFKRPLSVSVNSNDGTCWVADTDNNRVIRLFADIRDGYDVNTDSGSHITVVGFYSPYAVSVEGIRDSCWVADTRNNRVVKLEAGIPDGYDINNPPDFPQFHRISTGFNDPYDVSVNSLDGTCWVVDRSNHQIVKLSSTNTEELLRIGGFNQPHAVEVNPTDGSCWVADTGNHQIVRLSASGTEIFRLGNFNSPRAIAVNSFDGSGWVADTANNQVVKILPGGTKTLSLKDFRSPVSVSVYTGGSVPGEPSASATISPDRANIAETITFTGIGTDPDGKVIKYQWDFDGDGAFDWESPSTGTTTYQYSDEGLYNPVFKVTDPNGKTALYYGTFVRIGNLRAIPGADASSGTAPFTVNFSGDFYDPEDGRIERYQWDFDGDGLYEYDSYSTGNITYTYQAPGTYQATLKVVDTGNMTATTSITIDVLSSPPTAQAAAEPLNGRPPLSVTFTGSGSDDGTIMLYEWDFDGDDSYDWASAKHGNAVYTYQSRGVYQAKLRVTDNEALTGIASVTVTVTVPPTVTATVSPSRGNVPLEVNFDGIANDSDGTIALYEWDFDGDGIYDWSSQSSGQTLFSYTDTGTYNATLRITDNDGVTAEDSVNISVLNPRDPVASASVNPITGDFPLMCHFDGNATDKEGQIVLYEWFFGEDPRSSPLTPDWSSDSSGNTNYEYTSPGIYEAILRVTDSEGNRDAVPVEITVSKGNPGAVAETDISAGPVPLIVNLKGENSTDPNGNIVRFEWSFGEDREQIYQLNEEGYPLTQLFIGPWEAASCDDVSSHQTEIEHERPFVGARFGEHTWFAASDQDGNFDWNKVFVKGEDVYGYAYIELYSPKQQVVRIKFGADNAARFWINGELVYTKTVCEGVTIDQYTFEAMLRQGWNAVLVAVTNSYGDYGLAYRFTDLNDIPLRHIYAIPSAFTPDWSSGDSANVSYTYTTPGIYRATLRVMDNDGYTAEDTVTIRAQGLPAANILSPQENAELPREVFFGGYGLDSDGRVVLYEWDFDGDGVYDYRSSATANTSYSFAQSGSYSATLRVTDNEGLIGTSTVNYSVINLPPDDQDETTLAGNTVEAKPDGSPAVTASVDPEYAYTGQTIRLDGAGIDEDGGVTLYEWDFDGDGSFDWQDTTTGMVVSHTSQYDTTSWAAANLIDGRVGSSAGWSSSSSPSYPQDIVFSLPDDKTFTIDRVCLNPYTTESPSQWAKDVEILVSTTSPEDSDFTSTGLFSLEEMAEEQFFSFTPVQAKYVKLRITSSQNSPDYVQLGEFKVFAQGSGDNLLAVDGCVYHTYENQGTYEPIVKVTDDAGLADTDTVTVTVQPEGENTTNLWVADQYNRQVVKVAANGNELLRIGEFKRPYALDVNQSDGSCWVADLDADQVVKLSPDGSELARVTGFSDPYKVSVDQTDGSCWVADYGNDQVVKLSADGTELVRIEESFSQPASVSVNPADGTCWVADSDHNQVVKLTPDGRELVRVHGFKNPRDVAVDPRDGSCWVTDKGQHQVAKLAGDVPNHYDIASTGFIVEDNSVNHNHGNLYGNVHFVEKSALGQAVSFDGDSDYITVNYHSDYRPENQITLEGWFKTDDWGKDELGIISTTENGGWSFRKEGDRLEFLIEVDGTYYRPGTAISTVSLAQWHHFAGTFDGSQVKFYLDGDLMEIVDADGSLITYNYNNAMQIGAEAYTESEPKTDQYFAGQIDEVRIWNVARTQEEIQAEMNRELIGSESGLVGYWKFNAPAGPFHTIIKGFDYPFCGTVNPTDGTYWVSDRNHNQVVKISADGQIELVRAGGYADLGMLAVNPVDGTCWASDTGHGRIVKLSPNGTVLLSKEGYYNPTAIALDTRAYKRNQPPAARADADRISGDAPLTVTFTGTGSDQNGNIILYEWDFEGDGVYDYSSETSGNTSHTYQETGIYQPVLRVTDNDRQVAYDSLSIHVGPLRIIEAEAHPTSGNAPVNVDFTAQAISPYAKIIRYEWDFGGDGTFDWDWAQEGNKNSKTAHTYRRAGTYFATLRATNALGDTAETSIPITINPSNPVAAANVKPTNGPAPLAVTLIGSSSSDADGAIALYEWDYDGDGTYDWFSEKPEEAYVMYTVAGTYTPTLRVTDNDGLTATASQTVTVGKELIMPTVKVTADAAEGVVPLSVTFTCACGDSDGTITLYEWDFDGDGTYDESSEETGDIAHTYHSTGIFKATLRVTDDDGLTATNSVLIAVKDSGTPNATASTDAASGVVPLTVTFDATASFDADGEIVSYEWTFGDESVVWVADYNNDSVSRLQGFQIDKTLTGFSGPLRLVVNQNDGTVWVSDYGNDQVVKLKADGSGELVRASGFDGPRDLSIHQTDGSVWIPDEGNDQVVKLDSNGTELVRLSGFDNPRSVAVDQRDGSVWVTDTNHDQMVKLAPNGTELVRVSGFDGPWHVSVNQTDGSVWVADRYNNSLVKLASDTPDGYDISSGQDTPYHTTLPGFNAPVCTAVNPLDGTVWICDYDNNQMVRVAEDGNRELARISGFNDPARASVNPLDGTIWVADEDNHQIVLLSADGEKIREIKGLFADPYSVAEYTPSGAGYRSTTGGATTHTYTQPGTYIATLTVTDNDGKWDMDSVFIDAGVLESIPRAYPTSGQAPLNVSFSANGHSPNTTIEYFNWDFDGDGTPDWSTRIPEQYTDGRHPWYTYYYPGTYMATQTVIDNKGRFNSTSIPITVTLPEIPEAKTDANPVRGSAPLTVTFAGYGKSPDGTIRLFEWDFDGDGTFDWSSEKEGITSHTYSSYGVYRAVLRVKDNDGSTGTDEVWINVQPEGSPVALISADLTDGKAPLAVSFTGRATDNNGSIMLYEWDFDGDGAFDRSSPTSGNATYHYAMPGTYKAVLRVTDNDGLSDYTRVTITVTDGDITAVRSREAFDPTSVETMSITSSIAFLTPAFTLRIIDPNGNTIRTLVDRVARDPGVYTDVWDGKTDQGVIVPSGAYFFVIDYELQGVMYHYDLTANSGEKHVITPTYPGEFSAVEDRFLTTAFVLDTPAEISAFVSPFNENAGNRIRTLCLMAPRKNGKHVIVWDGTQDDGSLTPLDQSYVMAVFTHSLSDNAIIVETRPRISDVSTEPDFYTPGNPYSDELLEISYRLSKDADVHVTIRNEKGIIVRSFLQQNVAPGYNTITWDGRTGNGELAHQGLYVIGLSAIDAAGSVSQTVHGLVKVFY